MAGRRANSLPRFAGLGPARAALAALSLLLVVWFVVLARDERVGRQGADKVLFTPGMSEADWRHSIEQMREADFLNPGSQWDVTRAASLMLRDPRAALRAAEGVVSSEPDNLRAWNVILRASRALGDPRAARAQREVTRLNPLSEP